MAVSTVKLNGTTLMTVNDTTATQADVNSSKYFYGADGVKRQGSATPSTPTLITKSITANGTYNASSDSADGYSSVTVNVSGGASNVVTGTFKGTTTGAAMDVTLNYSGSGYPVALLIYPDGGRTGNSTYNSAIQRYANCNHLAVKSNTGTACSYRADASTDSYDVVTRYKNSTSSSTSYTQTSSTYTVSSGGAATSTNVGIATFKSKITMSVYIASSSYGFMANIDYKYWVMYSS